MPPSPTSRRQFIKTAVSTAAAPWIIPATAWGTDTIAPPSQRITLGFIGVGMMGQGHHRRFLQQADTQVLAICDVDTWRRENAQQLTLQTYAERTTSGTYKGCDAYRDLRDLLARADIDAVVIATGDRWHGVASVLAAEAGKDIYCEKPMSLTIYQARAMVDAVRRYGRVFQTGLQQRSAREFRLAANLVRDGALGTIRDVYVHFPGTSSDVDLPAEPVPDGLDWDLWLGPAPWRPFNSRFHIYGRPPRVVPWDFCRDFGGGNLTSNAVHSFDVVQWAPGCRRNRTREDHAARDRRRAGTGLHVRRRPAAARGGPQAGSAAARDPGGLGPHHLVAEFWRLVRGGQGLDPRRPDGLFDLAPHRDRHRLSQPL